MEAQEPRGRVNPSSLPRYCMATQWAASVPWSYERAPARAAVSAAAWSGAGQALGVAVETLVLVAVGVRAVVTVAPIRASVRHPVPVALEVTVVPEHGCPFETPNGWSVDVASATAWRAP